MNILVRNQPNSHPNNFFYAAIAFVDLGLLIAEVTRAHSDIQYSVELLWTSDQPVAETST